jgi:hypothetical protein
MTDKTFDPKLWTERSPDETRALYTDWAATYDADVTGAARSGTCSASASASRVGVT